MSLRVSERVREELKGIARWYDDQPSRYGSEFLKEVEAALLAIEANPRLYSLAQDGRPGCEDREYYIARFKQRVIYTIVGDEVWLLTVVHASRREDAWHADVKPPEAT